MLIDAPRLPGGFADVWTYTVNLDAHTSLSKLHRQIHDIVADVDEPSTTATMPLLRPEQRLSDIQNGLVTILDPTVHVLFYATRLEQVQPGVEKWSLTPAQDRPDHPFPRGLRERKKPKTIKFFLNVHVCGDRPAEMRSARIEAYDPTWPSLKNAYDVPCLIRLVPDQYPIDGMKRTDGVPAEAVARVQQRPILQSVSLPETAEAQLAFETWRTFLTAQKDFALRYQFCVPVKLSRRLNDNKRLACQLSADRATIDGIEALPRDKSKADPNFWQRLEQVHKNKKRNEQVALLVKLSDDGVDYGPEDLIGTIETVNHQEQIIEIQPTAEALKRIFSANALAQPQAEYFLVYSPYGSRVQVGRQWDAWEQINPRDDSNSKSKSKRPRCSPLLPLLFTGALDPASLPDALDSKATINLHSRNLFDRIGKPLDSDQGKAVAAVLASSALTLLQGPPGAGKTTLIAALCHEIAARGGRVLIAAQSNLAVFNAQDRVQRLSSDAVRPLRKGRSEKMADNEGKIFTYDNAPATWLAEVGARAERRRKAWNDAYDAEKGLVSFLPDLERYIGLQTTFVRVDRELTLARAEDDRCRQALIDIHSTTADLATARERISRLDEIRRRSAWDEATWDIGYLQDVGALDDTDRVENYVTILQEALDTLRDLFAETPLGAGYLWWSAWVDQTVNQLIPSLDAAIILTRELDRCVAAFHQASGRVAVLHAELRQDVALLLHEQEAVKRSRQEMHAVKDKMAGLTSAAATVDERMVARELVEQLQHCLSRRVEFTGKVPIRSLAVLEESAGVRARRPWQPSLTALGEDVNVIISQAKARDEQMESLRRIEQDADERIEGLKSWSIPREEDITRGRAVLAPKIDGLSPLRALDALMNELRGLNARRGFFARRLSDQDQATSIYAIRQAIQDVMAPPKVDPEQSLRDLAGQAAHAIVDAVALWQRTEESRLRDVCTAKEHAVQDVAAAYKERLTRHDNLNRAHKEESGHSYEAYATARASARAVAQIIAAPTVRHQVAELLDQLEPAVLAVGHCNFDALHDAVRNWEDQRRALARFAQACTPAMLCALLKDVLDSRESHLTAEKEQINQRVQHLLQTRQRLDQELAGIPRQRDELAEQWKNIREFFIETARKVDQELVGDTLWYRHARRIIDIEPAQSAIASLDSLECARVACTVLAPRMDERQTWWDRYDAYVERWKTRVKRLLDGKLTGDPLVDRRVYEGRANVVGITCNQAGSTSRDPAKGLSMATLGYFDLVIIDEVSTCTPPEALIPALRADRLVLVGDHKQLGPLITTEVSTDVARRLHQRLAGHTVGREDKIGALPDPVSAYLAAVVDGTSQENEHGHDGDQLHADLGRGERIEPHIKAIRDRGIPFLTAGFFKQRFEQYETAAAGVTSMLRHQYRMQRDIMDVINVYYHPPLLAGLPNDNEQFVHHLESPDPANDSFLQPQHHVVWVTTPHAADKDSLKRATILPDGLPSYAERSESGGESDGSSYYNCEEVEIVARICACLNARWAQFREKNPDREEKQIGIITPYKRQLRELNTQLMGEHYDALNLRLGTIDRFQGMEREVIIVSLVRNNNLNFRHPIGFSDSNERTNVAFSRAQQLLIIVGSSEQFLHDSLWSGGGYIRAWKEANKHHGAYDRQNIPQ